MWTDDKTIYHIYPLGLCGAPLYNDGQQENRIKTVLNFIPHLENLGVGGVYFGPIFESDKHGYDTRDYFKTDVRLGEISDFKEVFDALHQKGIKVILDGVFNHVDFGSIADVNWWTWIITPLITMVFSSLASLLLYPKLTKTDMNASLKTLE